MVTQVIVELRYSGIGLVIVQKRQFDKPSWRCPVELCGLSFSLEELAFMDQQLHWEEIIGRKSEQKQKGGDVPRVTPKRRRTLLKTPVTSGIKLWMTQKKAQGRTINASGRGFIIVQKTKFVCHHEDTLRNWPKCSPRI